MYRDSRDRREIPLTVRLSERQLLKVWAVAKRRGAQFAATLRDLLMEGVLMAEHDSARAAAIEDSNQMLDAFNYKNDEVAVCRTKPATSRFRPRFASASSPSPSRAESPSTMPCARCSPNASR